MISTIPAKDVDGVLEAASSSRSRSRHLNGLDKFIPSGEEE